MLRQKYFGTLTEKQREYIDGIHQSSQHLMQLINDILDLASIEAGYMQLEVTRFDIYAMMQSVLPLVQERMKEMDLTLQFECPKKIGSLVGDETRIRQMLFKLLSNAIKFSPAGSAIIFGASEEEEGKVTLWVADRGYGIPLDEQEAVFEKFHKGRNPDVPKSIARTGTGLGLSIIKSFVELHGGSDIAGLGARGGHAHPLRPAAGECGAGGADQGGAAEEKADEKQRKLDFSCPGAFLADFLISLNCAPPKGLRRSTMSLFRRISSAFSLIKSSSFLAHPSAVELLMPWALYAPLRSMRLVPAIAAFAKAI